MVSVVVPVYNAEEYLDDCIKSILKQTFSDYELILVNDGSKDHSLKKSSEWAKKDRRIKVIDKENGGVSTARNCGIEAATGEYITFIDSDDVISEKYIESLINEMNPDIDIVVLGMSYLKGTTVEPMRHRLEKGRYDSDYIKRIAIDDGTMSGFCFHSPCAILYRKSLILINGLRFNPEIRYNEDGLFNTQYLFCSEQNVYVDFSNQVYFYRINANSSTHKLDLLSQSYFDAMEQVERQLLLLTGGNDEYDVKKQCEAKYITNSLSQLIYAVKGDSGIKSIKTIVRDKRYLLGLKQVNYSLLSSKKKILFMVLKSRCPSLIYCALKVVL